MKRVLSLALCLCLILTQLAGCSAKEPMNPKDTITLTMWHVYGSQTDSLMNEMITEFNRTTGKDNGVTITVTSVSNSDDIHTALVASAKNQPGAGSLPDIFVCYPKTAIEMGTDLLMDWNDYFSEEEKSQYIPAFMEEGVIDDEQIIFPAAKSSEVMFINRTVFERFSKDTGVTLDDLVTWEGLFDASIRYAVWTDAQTPDVAGDGKAFLFYDMPFNYMQLSAHQLGEDLFSDKRIDFDSPIIKSAWDKFAQTAISGGINLGDGFGTSEMMIGETVANVASTASIIYFKDTVTYPDNTSEPLELISLPYPVFMDGEKSVIQRGVGLGALSGDKAHEEAAALFAKWFTEMHINTDFCIETGYMPVRQDAYESLFAEKITQIDNPEFRSLFEAIAVMYRDYSFYTPPLWDGFAKLQYDFVAEMKAVLLSSQESVDANTSEASNLAWRHLNESFG